MTPLTQAKQIAIGRAEKLIKALKAGEDHRYQVSLLIMACGELDKYEFEARQEAARGGC